MSKRPVLPPVYFLAAMLVMSGLHFLLPIRHVLSGFWAYLGGAVIGASVVLAVVSARLFHQHGTTIKPFEESTTLVITGPFKYSRNPLYLSLVGILVGLAFVLGTATPVVVIPVFVWLITRRFIVVEEAALAARFGDQYAAYKARVRRWL